MIKLAVFDLDGTLLNTLDDLADACNHALSVHGFPLHETDTYRWFVGSGVRELVVRMLPESHRNDPNIVPQVQATYSAYYKKHSQDQTGPYPGMVSALQALRAEGVSVAVLTNKPHIYVPELMEQYFPGLIDFALGQREGVPIKPDTTAVCEILAHFQVEPRQCLYIGDTDIDMQTGLRAGLHTVGVSWGFRTKKELEKNGAHVIINKPMDLLKLVIDKRE